MTLQNAQQELFRTARQRKRAEQRYRQAKQEARSAAAQEAVAERAFADANADFQRALKTFLDELDA